MKVLVVDDVFFMRKLLSDKLIKMGHSVIEAENGLDAIEKSKLEQPDVIFMDIVMPKMDGLTAVRRLKNETDGKIIMCSAIGDKNRIVEALKAGACDYILKPFNEIRIQEALKVAIGKQREELFT